MKKIFFLLTIILLIAAEGYSQAPGILNYQGVARNSVGNVLVNQNITLRLTIRDNTAAGPTVYQETRAVTTNPFGLFNVQLGSPGASGVTGTIAGVPWGVGLKFIQVEIDPNGGSSFINIGTAQLASVPYSLYSNLAGDLVLPFNKTQADAGTLFKITNSGTGSGSTALEGLTNSTAGSANAIIGTVTSAGPGGFSSGVRGINNGTGGLGIGVYGSQAGSGWGVYGITPSGIGVNGASTSGTGVNGSSTSGTGVFGTSSTGVAGIFINTNAANASDALRASTNGTGAAGLFTNSNAANNTPTVIVNTNGTSATALSLRGPGIWGSAMGITNTTSGMEWRTSVNNTTYTVTKVPGSTFSPLQLFSTGGIDLSNSAGTSIMRLLDNGDVGIGTTTPFSRLTVVQNNSGVNLGGGAATGSEIKFLNSGTAHLSIYNSGNNALTFANTSALSQTNVPGTPLMTLTTAGRLGIGTTTPARNLHVVGNVNITDGTQANNFVLRSDAAGNANWADPALLLPGATYWTRVGTNLWNTNLGDNVGIGTTTPTSRFNVVHAGASGIDVTSTGSFSTVDIDAFSGDAALRFYDNGAGRWNMRNRPSDDALEFFSLNNATSRMIIQDATGNVGIGETANPTYKLHVLHGGADGIISRSSSSFSLVDIDAANGDAALRFQAAGVSMWNTRNEPGTNNYQIFEMGGGGERVQIQDGTGNVGIGGISPSYRLDVQHGGATGIRSVSTGSFSVVDIDAASGDAALRFQKAGVGQWNTRNRPADDYYEIFELGGGGSRFVIQDGTGNVGIGQTVAPSYKLDVLHGGSTGARIQSSASFSVVDIDAASGDAALRFQKAGVGQWNTRNRPADDYYEIFELGGGGSRFVIQDGTGNVGIGQTVAPSYKLDVLHGGSTGARIQSSSSFSVVDIDAASGDAALRFAKAGVNQWNVRNRPADDYFEIFELGGGGSRVVIQDGTGNVGIGNTTSPAYKLDVLHGGSTGARIESSASFSVVDIDAASGDAALRYARAGVNQWNVRNNPGNDDYQIFELGGGGERMRIENTTGNVVVSQDFTVLGVKAFTMDHPLDPANKLLRHAAAESNEVINFYSGNVTTDASGKATVTLPDYYEALNKDSRYQLTVIGSFAQAIISKEVNNNQFEIATSVPNVKVSWEVKGVRNDNRMKQHPFVAVEEKTGAQKGKYWDPASHNQPATKGVSYDVNIESSLNDIAPVKASKVAPATTGGSLDQAPVVPAAKKTIDNSGSVENVQAAKTTPKTLPVDGSVAPQATPDKKAEVKPVDVKGTSLEDKVQPVENKKVTVDPGSTKTE